MSASCIWALYKFFKGDLKMDNKEFTQLGQLLKKWADEQAICEHRCYDGCYHPRNNYSRECGLRQCPNPSPREDRSIIYPEGKYEYFWIQDKEILFRKFKL
jgi:hypothetical protein